MSGDRGTVLIANPGADLYGSDRMAVESVKALVGAGYRVFVTVPGAGPLVPLLTEAGATVLEQATPIIRKSLRSTRGLVQLVRETVTNLVPSWRLLRHTDAGTVMVNTITPPLWFLVARLAGRTVVCHVHEAEGTASALVRKALYLPLVFCHRIVINSRFSMDVLARSASWLRDRTAVVYNAVGGPDEVVPAREVLVGPVRLLYVGRLSHRKGPHVAVEALKMLVRSGQPAHLSLLGAVFPGNEGYEAGLRRRVTEWGLDGHVTWLGFKSSVWRDLACADIVVIPSTVDEPFGNTAVEASLAARPLIVSDIAGLKEASMHASGRIAVPAGDAQAIALAVEEIIAGWTGFRERASRDAMRAAQEYSAQKYAGDLLRSMGLTEE